MAEEKKQEETTEEKAPEVAAEAPAEEPKAEEAPKEEPKAEETPAEVKADEPKAEAAEAPKEEAKEAAPEEVAEAEPEEPQVEGDFVMANVALKPGLTVRIHQRINEGEKSRVQVFEGMILKLRGATPETKTVTVRKMASGTGVEKIFPLALPSIEKVELVKEAKVRRSKLYYLRDHKKKLRETLLT